MDGYKLRLSVYSKLAMCSIEFEKNTPFLFVKSGYFHATDNLH